MTLIKLLSGIATVALCALFAIGLIISAFVSKGCSWLDKAGTVVEKQLDPELLLKKYEWFKDVSATLDKKMADIEVYRSRLDSMNQTYGSTPRKDWDRTDKEQYNLWTQEVAGTIASYNALAAEYNSAMSKINYSFTNIGELPKGATKPLPREFKPYQK